MMRYLTLCIIAILSFHSIAHAQFKSDSTYYKKGDCSFNARQLIVPSCLIAGGALGVHYGNVGLINSDIENGWASVRGTRLHFDDYIQYLPAAAYLSIGSIGVECRHNFAERLAVGATSTIALLAMVNGIKYTVREPRPDGSARNSFPSGHTATAFMGAELVRKEYGGWYGAAAYGCALTVGIMRTYNKKHWFNDVVAGAGVGILCAQIGYWLCKRSVKTH